MKTLLLRFTIAFLTLCLVLGSPPTLAANPEPDRIPLTLEILQQRLKSPVNTEGIPTLDLQHFIIDLRPENSIFSTQFYQLLKTALGQPGNPIGLDLSNSLIQGEFMGSELGIRAPLYGQALSPLFTPTEFEQLQRYRRFFHLQQLSTTPLTVPPDINIFRGPLKLNQTRFSEGVSFNKTFFLKPVEVVSATFRQGAAWSENRFSQPVNFTGTTFRQDADFQSSLFLGNANFNQVQFQGTTNFENSEFHDTANFHKSQFQHRAKFREDHFQNLADFSESRWQDQADFSKSLFTKPLLLNQSIFEKMATFRQSQFNQTVNLRGTSLNGITDFSGTRFAKGAYLSIPELMFDANQAKLMGDTNQIGQFLSVPTLQGNENVLRGLIRNFRLQEQIPDANQVEYLRANLRQKAIRSRLFGVNINTASLPQLMQLGFSPKQADVIIAARTQQPFRNLTELLQLDSIDLETYTKIGDAAIAEIKETRKWFLKILGWFLDLLQWFWLILLLLLSGYGTQFWLIFGVGIITIAYFGLIFWFVDRWRRRLPTPILPTISETIWMLTSFLCLNGMGLAAIFGVAKHPGLTLTSLGIVIVPIPAILLVILYQKGRYHDLIKQSYFTEDGTLRQLRLMIGRMPIIPRYPLFRERYMAILGNRRWNWLNYYDFSLNNLLKVGFNDIRLRDEHLPGLISTLVWYEWILGIFYLTLLLWTLSRTIPGLNLLIYLK